MFKLTYFSNYVFPRSGGGGGGGSGRRGTPPLFLLLNSCAPIVKQPYPNSLPNNVFSAIVPVQNVVFYQHLWVPQTSQAKTIHFAMDL